MMSTKIPNLPLQDMTRVPKVIEVNNHGNTSTLKLNTFTARFEITPSNQNSILVPMILKQIFRI